MNSTCINSSKIKVEDIKWIVNLIREHGDTIPEIKSFSSSNRRVFYKEYGNLRLIEEILYRNAEDRHGFNRTQFVLPKHTVKEVVNQIYHPFTMHI